MSEPDLERFDRLVGRWATEATHPATGELIIHGTADVEWLTGRRFLIHRAGNDHPDFPDSISIIGVFDRDRVDDPAGDADDPTESLRMHYFDSRGVFRVYEVGIDDFAWRMRRDAPGFSQRFTGVWAEMANTLVGQWELNEDDRNWADDLRITYRRQT